MNIVLKRAGWTVTALLVGGLVVAWSGIINVAASSGHWPITNWFLHWVMQNSVRTHAAMNVDEPATDPTGLVSASGHFAANCAPCHGAPGVRRAMVMQAATPAPPALTHVTAKYDSRELFWIIKHGVKFTAMPAWPAQDRDDEVRRMVAFVQGLSRMSPREYRELAYGSGQPGGAAPRSFATALADCERCHEKDGRGQPDIPVLAGQNPEYLLAALEEFASGRRTSAVMGAAAARMDPPMWRALAEHYAALPGLGMLSEAATVRGVSIDPMVARIITRGLPEANLPACVQCHASGKRPQYPALAGQKAEYLAGRLRRWRAEQHVVEARRSTLTMPVIARRIPEPMIDPLARHLASAPAASRDRPRSLSGSPASAPQARRSAPSDRPGAAR